MSTPTDLLVIPNQPERHVQSIMRAHDEALVIIADPSGIESNLAVFTKFKEDGVLSSYLRTLLANLLNRLDGHECGSRFSNQANYSP